MYALDHISIEFQINGQDLSFQLNELPSFEDKQGVRIWVEKEEALSGERWRLFLHSSEPVRLKKLHFEMKTSYDPVKNLFCNGFQSWSETKLYKKTDVIKGLRTIARPIMKPFGDYTYYDYPEKKGILHSWGYTYATLPGKKVLFIGSLDERNAFTNFVHHCSTDQLTIERDVAGWTVNNETTIADFFLTENSERGAIQHYFLLNKYPEVRSKPAIGWTSWYHYYTGITEKIILDNLQSYVKSNLPIDIFQIDDGYQEAVGDWLIVNKKFPQGMTKIAMEIKKAGAKPGIWLAPLAAEKKSTIVKNKPDWLMKDEKGKPVKIGYNPLWSGAFYALDIYHPEVRAYVKKVFQTVINDWGFELVKLDFLYGACLVARNGRSRGGVMQDAMELLRSAVGDKEILGCGIPMGTAPGMTDYCRTGADVHLKWDFNLLKWSGNRERVSTILALQNTIHRRQLNQQAFINDPDVFILRKKKQNLSFHEQYTLLLVNLLFGDLLFTSDNIADYDDKTMNIYRSIFPLLDKKELQVEYAEGFYRINFGVGDRRFLALINLSEENKLYKMPAGLFFEPLQQEIVSSEQTIPIIKHQSVLFNLVGGGLYAVMGSNGHFFPGAEVKKVAMSGNLIKVSLIEGLQKDPEVFLKVPDDVTIAFMNEHPVKTIKKKGFNIVHAQLSRHETTTDPS